MKILDRIFRRTASTVRRRPGTRFSRNFFEAASTDRLTQSWSTTPVSADDVVRRNYTSLVARSRHEADNNDYAKKFVRLCVQNIVGPKGVLLQAQARDFDGNLDNQANDALEDAWDRWGAAKSCDVGGQLSWRAIQSLCITSAARDGEFFIKMVHGPDAGPWGFALQVIDPTRCPVHLDQDHRTGGSFIRQGIEFNMSGRPLAYYFMTTDDGRPDYSFEGKNYRRIPASEIIHGFLPDIVGQKRGLPWMATSLWRLHMLKEFEHAALVNARTAAAKCGFFKHEFETGDTLDENEELYMEAKAGVFQELPAGVSFQEWNPSYPSGEFHSFQKAMLRGAASGMGVAYNNLANDLEGVNYSSIRQGTLDEREHWKWLQEWLIETLHEPVFGAWLPKALLHGVAMENGGSLRPDRLEKYSRVAWQPRRWQWIDPAADIKAAIAAKNNMLSSPSQIIREQGRDPDSVWREIARDICAMEAAGIPKEYIGSAIGLALGAPTQASAEKTGEPE